MSVKNGYKIITYLLLTFVCISTYAGKNGMMNTEYFYAPPFSFDELKLSIVRNSTSSVYDYTTILFNTAGTAASTDSDDFFKFFNANLSFYSISSDNNDLSIDERSNSSQTIALGLSSNVLDNFTFRADIFSFPSNVQVNLIDSYLSTSTPLSNGAAYSFAITSAAASQGDSRFSLQVIYGPRYYFTSASSNSDFNTLTNWSSNADGSGSHPSSLSVANTMFYLQANANISSDVILGSGSEIVVGATEITAVTLTISSSRNLSGKINISAAQSGSNTINVAGSITTLGVLHKTSTVNYSSGGQSIASGNYGNLTLSNNSGINTASGNIVVYNNVTITGGGKMVVGNHQFSLNDATATVVLHAGSILDLSGSNVDFKSGHLTISSASDGSGGYRDASLVTDIATVLNGANNVTVQRYVSQHQRGWRLIGHPLQSTVSYHDLANNSTTPIDITYTNPSAEIYDSNTNSWSGITDANAVWPLSQTIALFIRGISGEGINADFPNYNVTASSITNGNKPSTVTLSVTGTLNTSAPSAITTSNNYFYLVSNPYAAPISASSVLSASSGLSNVIATYNPMLGAASAIVKAGGYEYHTPFGSAGGSNDFIIPVMGAFFVQDNGGGVINVPHSVMINSNNNTAAATLYSENNEAVLKLNIEGENNLVYDAVQLMFDSNSTSSTGDKYDFKKLPNTILNFCSVSTDQIPLAIDQRNFQVQTIPLNISSSLKGDFFIKADEYKLIPNTIKLELKDNYLQTTKTIEAGMLFPFTISADSATQGNKRFELLMTKTSDFYISAADTISEKFDARIINDGVIDRLVINVTGVTGSAEMAIRDMIGRFVIKGLVHNGVNTILLPKLAMGFYIVEIYNDKTKWAKKFIR